MTTIFTRIIEGELPGRFVWRDERCVVFLSISPLRPGHALVVPITEIDQWVDLPPELASHLMQVAHTIGRAQIRAFEPSRVGLIIAGLEVPHCHIHLVPMQGMADLDFANASTDTTDEAFDDAARRLRAALTDLGGNEFVSD
jgi:histidine triad (HIT) family protein